MITSAALWASAALAIWALVHFIRRGTASERHYSQTMKEHR